MQFTTIVLALSAALAVSAAPGPQTLARRTCGTLSGRPLQVCQEACKVTCDVSTGGLARKLCKEACDAGPLKARSEEPVLAKRTCGTLSGRPLQVCQEACKVTCDVSTGGLARKLCKEACDAGPLKARSEEDAVADEVADEATEDATDDSADETTELSARGVGRKICDASCDVACNSTVLALDQLACLRHCKAKC